eukprot:TRINITY_DN3954_c0_g1_i1.p1 TRINITY_DN3954_c0_g1~~TRINITY_DN3954_c0_g1_i1.p1  ORF type:complete len:533 (+),score=66.15 TRINITY_DN3954_c0_g1_i1:73-1599(+)
MCIRDRPNAGSYIINSSSLVISTNMTLNGGFDASISVINQTASKVNLKAKGNMPYTFFYKACLNDTPSTPQSVIAKIIDLSSNTGVDDQGCLIGAIVNDYRDATISIGGLIPDRVYYLFVFGQNIAGELSQSFLFTVRTKESPAPLVFGFGFNKKPSEKELAIFICDLAYFLGVSDTRLITEKYQRCNKDLYRRVLQQRRLEEEEISEDDEKVEKYEEIVQNMKGRWVSREMYQVIMTFSSSIKELNLDWNVLSNMGPDSVQRLLSLYHQYQEASTKSIEAIERIYLLPDNKNLEDLPESYSSNVNSDMKVVYFLTLHNYQFVPVLVNLQVMSIDDLYPGILLDGFVLRGMNELMLLLELSLPGLIQAIVLPSKAPKPSSLTLSAGADGSWNKAISNASFSVKFNETLGRNQQARMVFPNIPCGQELVIYYQIGIDIPTQFRPYPVIYSVQVNSTPCNIPINVTANSSSRNIPKGRLLLQVQEFFSSLYQRFASSSLIQGIKSLFGHD